MSDLPSTTDHSDDAPGHTRRQYLRSAGGLGAVSVTGQFLGNRPMWRTGPPSSDDPSGGREDFLWVHGWNLRNEKRRTNLFAFASRHDLAVVIPVQTANFDAVESSFRRALQAATAAGLDVWIRVGLLTEIDAEAFVSDPEARRAHLDRLRRVCRVYDELTEDGRVILWEEAPVMGQWVEGGEWNAAATENMLEHGPRIFDAQRRVVDDAVGDREVGIFVHFPYIVDSKSPGVFATLTDRLDERDARPDFAFVDFYRGWYEKDTGPGLADATVKSLIRNAREELGGNPVFYLGQAHTINPKHTPSKQSIRSNLRASLDADADGLGWYARTTYHPTKVGFDPFVPNAPDATFEGQITTDTVARDRFLYAWVSTLATRRGFDRRERFDLWLWGEDLSFYDHRLSARTPDGWTFLCDLDGYADGEYPYGADADGNASIVRALSRNRWLDDGTVTLRIETASDADRTELRGALAMPCHPDAYVTEYDAASLLAGDTPVETFALGSTREVTPLVPGKTSQVTIPIRTTDPPSLHGLKHPDSLDAVRRLQAVDDRTDIDPDDQFDLWLQGRGLSDPAAAPSLVDRTGTTRSPDESSVAALGTDDVALYYGLDRETFLRDGLTLAEDGADGARVGTAYAMPAAGSAAFRSPSQVNTLLTEQPDEVLTFSLATAERS